MQQKQRISALTIQTVENFAVYKASARYLHCGKINCVENQPNYISIYTYLKQYFNLYPKSSKLLIVEMHNYHR